VVPKSGISGIKDKREQRRLCIFVNEERKRNVRGGRIFIPRRGKTRGRRKEPGLLFFRKGRDIKTPVVDRLVRQGEPVSKEGRGKSGPYSYPTLADLRKRNASIRL